jgi:hypothetical protein
VLLLTPPTSLAASAKDLLDEEYYHVNDVVVFGGTVAVSNGCKQQIEAAVW